jgi:hypothetical protein
MNLAGLPRLAAANRAKQRAISGLTLIEVVIGVAVLAIVVVTLYTMLAGGFNMVQNNRDNLRATQILVNRMEGLRLFNWDQLIGGNMIPANFVESYAPSGGTNAPGTLYYGRMTISPVSLTASYSSQMRLVTVNLNWTNGSMSHARSMSTYVSQYGVQNYVFAN